MCGITGFIDHTNRLNEQNLKKASATLKHRGGNGNGIIFEQKEHYTLGLANQRLATIDLSKKGLQPLTSNCGNYSITFNGTIYNFLELRETLIKYGVIFDTLTDTEVILESYKKWGNGAFEKLDGSFAFVIFDRKLNQLIIARDELGTKPLYFYKTKGIYAFASEIKALLSYSLTEKRINKTALGSYFRNGYFLGDLTIFEDIFKFKKGNLTILDIHSGNSYDTPLKRNKIYLDQLPAVEQETESQILDKIEELLTESILKRNVADVPVGVLLSGGYDSTTIAAILQKNQSKRIKTFTIGFEGEKINDAPQAKKIAAHLKTNHQEFYLDKNIAYQILQKLPTIFEEPIGNSSVIPLLFIAEKVNKEVKVLLSAEGGDELFGGYRAYAKALKFNAFAENKIPTFLKNILTSILKKSNKKTKAILEADGLLDKYLEINACFTKQQINTLLNTPYNTKSDLEAKDIKGLLIYDLHNYLPNDILHKSDKCFMNFGVDNRNALLKMDLISYLNSLEAKWFLKDGQQKYLLKKITNKYVPAQLMHSTKKDFAIPLNEWLQTIFKPLVDVYLTEEKLNEHQLLNVEEVLKIKTSFNLNASNYNAQKIWLMLQFQMWYEQWIKIK